MKVKAVRKKPSLFIFILMPFDDPLTVIYRNYIQKPLESKGFVVKRADDIYKPSPILEDIIDKISSADLIIAELTGRNPNVFYELGRAHEQGKYVIQICQNSEDIPFDLRHIRTIIYKDETKELELLTQNLIKFIETYLNEGKKEKKINRKNNFNDVQEYFDEFIELFETLYYTKAKSSAGFVARIQNTSKMQKFFGIGAPKSNKPGIPDDDIEMTLLNGDFTLIPNSATLRRLVKDEYEIYLNKNLSDEEKRKKLTEFYEEILKFVEHRYNTSLFIKEALFKLKPSEK